MEEITNSTKNSCPTMLNTPTFAEAKSSTFSDMALVPHNSEGKIYKGRRLFGPDMQFVAENPLTITKRESFKGDLTLIKSEEPSKEE